MKNTLKEISNNDVSFNSLRRVIISHNAFLDIDMDSILESLHNHASIEILELSYNILTQENIEQLECLLNAKLSIKSLILKGNIISEDSFQYISEFLKCNSSLKRLEFSGFAITNECLISIASAISSNRSIDTLIVKNCGIAKQRANIFFKCISDNKSLREISLLNDGELERNVIEWENIEVLKEFVNKHSNLLFLKFDYTPAVYFVDSCIADIERDNATCYMLKKLSFRRNRLTSLTTELVSAYQSQSNISLDCYKKCLYNIEALEYWMLQQSQDNRILANALKHVAMTSIANTCTRMDSVFRALPSDVVLQIFSLTGNDCFTKFVDVIYLPHSTREVG